mmetsp:Transcript_26860/g.66889  ORF Transcript_26860/g.66889 Transcript_26860/m.66889 type:complete len:89 (-) Transcript_26860:264-530(-)
MAQSARQRKKVCNSHACEANYLSPVSLRPVCIPVSYATGKPASHQSANQPLPLMHISHSPCNQRICVWTPYMLRMSVGKALAHPTMQF